VASAGMGNRLGLLVIGLIGLVAGLAGLARGLDLWPEVLGSAQAPVLEQQVRELAAEDWFWPVVAITLAVVALLALWWLAVQGRRGTLRTILLEADARRGATTLPARAVSGAFADDLADGSQLRRVRARLVGGRDQPRLAVTATFPASADPAAAKQHLYGALGRNRRALDAPDLPATLKLH
jgi:hypothetical protein